MKFVKFNSSRETSIEFLYDNVDEVYVRNDNDEVLKCTVTWEQGRTRSALYDNYRFMNGSRTIWPEDVLEVHYHGLVEDASVLKLYTLHLQWRGCVVVTAYSLAEAKQLMLAKRDGIEDDIDKIVEHEISEGFSFVNYGDE